MRPGLSADDIYIMVEDEFLSTARLFTSHLHRAEYQRLKRLARDKPATSTESISRPVDSITKLRAETKKKKAAEAHAAQVQKMLGTFGGGTKKVVVDEEDGSEVEDLIGEQERGDEVGAGTVLAPLMKSPKKNLGSLSGLGSVRSTTRAAAGFERTETRREMDKGIMREFAKPKGKVEERAQEDEEESEADSDDLDRPAMKRGGKRVDRATDEEATIATEPARHVESTKFYKPKPAQDAVRTKLRTSTKPSSPLEPRHSTSPLALQKTKDAVLERLRARREQARKEKEKGLAIDEIPIFLV